MATKKADQAAAAEVLEARVLIACVVCGVALPQGAVVTGPAAALRGQEAIGVLDAHPDAVAYAREQGAPEIDVTPAPAADEAQTETKE